MPPKGSTKAAAPPVDLSELTAAVIQQKSNTASIADFELPKTSLTKLAKGSIPDNVKMQQDVVLALLRSSTLFISYLSAASHDQALARSGKSITASDVIKAITELDFGPADDLVPLLEVELAEAYRKTMAATKASKAANKPPGPGRGKRRKSNADGDDVDMDVGEDDEVEEIDEGESRRVDEGDDSTAPVADELEGED